MSFALDLQQGEAYEQRVIDYLSKFYNLELEKNPERRGVDILNPYGMTIEVKFDRRMEETGNIFIEYEYNGSPSGIFKYPDISILAYGCQKYFFIFNGNKIKKLVNEFVLNKKYRIINGGDGYKSRGILIPICDLLSNNIATRKLYL